MSVHDAKYKQIKRINAALIELKKDKLIRLLDFIDMMILEQKKEKEDFRRKTREGWKKRRELEENIRYANSG